MSWFKLTESIWMKKDEIVLILIGRPFPIKGKRKASKSPYLFKFDHKALADSKCSKNMV